MQRSECADDTGQIEAEQRYLDVIHTRLDAEVDRALSAQALALAAPFAGPEDLYARDLEVDRLTTHVNHLRSAEQSLCFGRIDSDTDGEQLHIGRIGLRTEDGEPLLVDWRAEAARPFYSATMVSPMGLHRRRHLRLADRVVVNISDEILDGCEPTADDVVGDDPLVSVLTGARTGKMREAAATLQTEQDEIVRSQHRGLLVVDGGPGTGKTIVALHRAAYVLYAFSQIADRGVLIFGPNSRFLNYISDVLPSLGENGVQLATLPDLIGVGASRTEPDHIARIKGSAHFADGLAQWVQARQPHGAELEVRTAHGSVVLTPGQVDAARRGALQGGIGHNHARELFTENVVDELVNGLEQQGARELSDFEAEIKELQGVDLDLIFAGNSSGSGFYDPDAHTNSMEIDWDQIRDELLEDSNIDAIVSRVWPRLRAEDAVHGLLSDRAALARLFPELTQDDLTSLVRRTSTEWSGAEWSTADLTLLDEARALIDGPSENTYGHIVVDEAQQLSAMQWRMLMRRCPQRSMTIVGDLAQAGPTTSIRTWSDALDPFVEGRFLHHTLTVNYRTTAEILQETEPLLARIAPQQQLSRSIRHGEKPRLITVEEAALSSALSELLNATSREHPGELIGVVTTAERFASLDAQTQQAQVTVVPAADARGLEFDTVIIIDPDGMCSANEAGLRDLYVAQTRATKRLLTLKVTANPC